MKVDIVTAGLCPNPVKYFMLLRGVPPTQKHVVMKKFKSKYILILLYCTVLYVCNEKHRIMSPTPCANLIEHCSRSVWMRIICWHKNKASNPHPISPMTVSVPCVWHYRTLTVSHPMGCAFLFPSLPPSIIQLSSGIQPYILCTIHLQFIIFFNPHRVRRCLIWFTTYSIISYTIRYG